MTIFEGEPEWTEIVEFECPSCCRLRDGQVRGYSDGAWWVCDDCGQVVCVTGEVTDGRPSQ